MKFEIYRDNIILFSSEHIQCMPTEEQLNSMNKSGHTFYIDSKKVALKKVKDFVKEKR